MARRPLIAANWKMNGIPAGALAHDSPYQSHADVDVWVFPTFLDIHACVEAKLFTGAQCGNWEEKGAHTGDVSMALLAKAGCRAVLCGHSERREAHGETNEIVMEQVIAALEHKLHPILCVGETAKDRKAKKHKHVVEAQLKNLPDEGDIIIAYEPVWAIGTGETATPEQAQEMHEFIRSLLHKDVQAQTRILYGGSVKPENAAALFSQTDIDGALVGGASLTPIAFNAIVSMAKESVA